MMDIILSRTLPNRARLTRLGRPHYTNSMGACSSVASDRDAGGVREKTFPAALRMSIADGGVGDCRRITINGHGCGPRLILPP